MKEDIKGCATLEGDFKICFVKDYDGQEKSFCLENVKAIKINSKDKE